MNFLPHLPIEELLSMKRSLENRIAWENRVVLYPPPGYKLNYALVRELIQQIDEIDEAIEDQNNPQRRAG